MSTRDEAAYTWLTPAEAGERLGGMSAATVRDRIRSGDLGPDGVLDISRGKRPTYRINPEAIEAYLEDSKPGDAA